jgi:hypothetical protein
MLFVSIHCNNDNLYITNGSVLLGCCFLPPPLFQSYRPIFQFFISLLYRFIFFDYAMLRCIFIADLCAPLILMWSCLRQPWRWMRYIHPKYWWSPTRTHGLNAEDHNCHSLFCRTCVGIKLNSFNSLCINNIFHDFNISFKTKLPEGSQRNPFVDIKDRTLVCNAVCTTLSSSTCTWLLSGQKPLRLYRFLTS